MGSRPQTLRWGCLQLFDPGWTQRWWPWCLLPTIQTAAQSVTRYEPFLYYRNVFFHINLSFTSVIKINSVGELVWTELMKINHNSYCVSERSEVRLLTEWMTGAGQVCCTGSLQESEYRHLAWAPPHHTQPYFWSAVWQRLQSERPTEQLYRVTEGGASHTVFLIGSLEM